MDSETNITSLAAVLEANVTVEQIASAFNLNISNTTNVTIGAATPEKLFSLYDAYRLKEKEQLLLYKSVAYVLGTMIILSNLTVVISSGLILRKGQQPKSTYLLLGNVSLADTIIGISLIFGTVVDNTVTSNIMCTFQIGMIVCPTMVSIFSVGFIAIDRYIFIIHGMYYQRWINTTRVRIGIIIIWLIGLILGFMPITGWTNQELVNTRCVYVSLFPGGLILINSILSVIPIVLVATLYSIILVRAIKNVTKIMASKKPLGDMKNTTEQLRIYRGIFIASLPATGWTGLTFTNFRCWYIAVFPSTLLVIVSIISLLIIFMVCVLYFLILHTAVKAVDGIKAFQETNHKIAYINKAFDEECKKYDEISETTVTITVSTDTLSGESCSEIEMHELNKINVAHFDEHRNKWCRQFRKKIVKISHYYKKAKAVNSHPSKFKAVKTVLLVTVCFVCTWAPYYVAIILYVNCDILKNGYACIPLETLTLGPLYFLGVTNSLCDPLIYAWWHTGFKRSLKKIYWKYVWKIRIFRLRHGWLH